MKYAEKTSVPVERSKAEIERTLARYGADQFISGWELNTAVIGFRMRGRQIKFTIILPDKERFKKTPGRGYKRDDIATAKAWEQACRQKWRSLNLLIKAKLEAIENEDADFESEFMAQIVLPTGQTVGELLKPQIDETYKTGNMPKLIPLTT